MRTHPGHGLGKAGLLVEIADDQRLLILPGPARRDDIHGKGRAGAQRPVPRFPAYADAARAARDRRALAEIGKIYEAVQTLARSWNRSDRSP